MSIKTGTGYTAVTFLSAIKKPLGRLNYKTEQGQGVVQYLVFNTHYPGAMVSEF